MENGSFFFSIRYFSIGFFLRFDASIVIFFMFIERFLLFDKQYSIKIFCTHSNANWMLNTEEKKFKMKTMHDDRKKFPAKIIDIFYRV